MSFASDELRQASQIIFDAAVPRLSDEEAGTLLEFWQCQRVYSLLLSFRSDNTNKPSTMPAADCGQGVDACSFSVVSLRIYRCREVQFASH